MPEVTVNHIPAGSLVTTTEWTPEQKAARMAAVVENWNRPLPGVKIHTSHGRKTTVNVDNMDWKTIKGQLDNAIQELHLAISARRFDSGASGGRVPNSASNRYDQTERQVVNDCIALAYGLAEKLDAAYPLNVGKEEKA